MQLSNNLSIYNDLFNSSNLGLRVTNSFSDTSYFHENIQNSSSPLFNNHKLKFAILTQMVLKEILILFKF
jgi:hypothetical protein